MESVGPVQVVSQTSKLGGAEIEEPDANAVVVAPPGSQYVKFIDDD